MSQLKFWFGVVLTLNFAIFWALPIFLQGILWKAIIKHIAQPIYNIIDKSESCRAFSLKYLYLAQDSTDYFATMIFSSLSIITSLAAVIWVQRSQGFLPMSYIIAYYWMWVGFGGRCMGAAYAFAHKEGHNKALYRPWFRNTVGNVFENIFGPMFGNVPYNFTTSHAYIHHKLDGGMGDTFYQWDLDRNSWRSLMLYVSRIFLHMTGYSSLKHFHVNRDHVAVFGNQFNLLLRGCFYYWIVVPALLLYATNYSWRFLFFIYLEPFCCMTYFLALLNFGFHGFLEYDGDTPIACVNNTCIIDDEDDYFGEDDHMAHHYAPTMHHRQLPAHQASQRAEWIARKASVFRTLSIVEVSILIVIGQWQRLAEHYVDYTGKMTIPEIKDMLKKRAKRTEISYDAYEKWAVDPNLKTLPKRSFSG